VRLSRGLAIRILAVALLVGGVSATAGFVISIDAVRTGLAQHLSERWQGGLRDELVAECEAAPESFHPLRANERLRFAAFDAQTGRSAHPDVEPEERGRLVDLTGSPQRRGWLRDRLVTYVRGADEGPCSAIRITLRPEPSTRRLVLRNVSLSVLAVALAAALFVLVIVVSPLRRRIARVRRAARAVGSDGYANDERDARDELGDVARAVDAAHVRIERDREALIASRAALERFLADVAHDLRTPLTSMRLALEELDDFELDPEAREILRAAFHDAVYASSLTDNLKLASRLEHGVDPLAEEERFDLRALVERVALRERVFARRSGMTLVTALPDDAAEISADALMVEQALTNVVQNAIIHGEGGGTIEVTLRDDDGGFVLEVADDGPGVPPEQLPRLGERAYRSDDARARDPKGSGLGLAITSEVCDRFGWVLTFEARAPRGLVVAIRGR